MTRPVVSKEQILEKVSSLPTLPTAVAQLSALLADPNSSVADFERVIRPDPSLTANLLRLANSAYFGLPCEVTSVGRAMSLMGTRRVFDMASSVAISRVIPDKIPGYEIESRGFWQHCIAVAMLAEQLASELGIHAPELTFTAGLLHDIGKLAVGSFLMDASEEILEHLTRDEQSMTAVERELLGTDHAEIGALVAEKWSLPEAVVWTARWHHVPGEAPAEVDRTLVDLIHTADGLAHVMGFGADVAELSREVQTDVAERLGLKAFRLERAACSALGEIRETSELLVRS